MRGLRQGQIEARSPDTVAHWYPCASYSDGKPAASRHAVVFFDGHGSVLGEADLAPAASPLSYSPLAAMDVDGTARKSWVIALGDGSIHVYSPRGQHRAQLYTGKRLLTFLVVPRQNGADLLVTATSRGLTGWRPAPARMTPLR